MLQPYPIMVEGNHVLGNHKLRTSTMLAEVASARLA